MNEDHEDKPVAFVKAADETVLLDNIIYNGGENMATVENKAHEDNRNSIVNAADEPGLMDNNVYESSGGTVAVRWRHKIIKFTKTSTAVL